MIKIIGKGDNEYQREFDNGEEAYDFLWSLVGKLYGYYRLTQTNDRLYVFDIEDDLIIWQEEGKEWYCAGWHWREKQRKEPIIMPNGRSLYSIFIEVTGEDNNNSAS